MDGDGEGGDDAYGDVAKESGVKGGGFSSGGGVKKGSGESDGPKKMRWEMLKYISQRNVEAGMVDNLQME